MLNALCNRTAHYVCGCASEGSAGSPDRHHGKKNSTIPMHPTLFMSFLFPSRPCHVPLFNAFRSYSITPCMQECFAREKHPAVTSRLSVEHRPCGSAPIGNGRSNGLGFFPSSIGWSSIWLLVRRPRYSLDRSDRPLSSPRSGQGGFSESVRSTYGVLRTVTTFPELSLPLYLLYVSTSRLNSTCNTRDPWRY
jgi:hypothetical protein